MPVLKRCKFVRDCERELERRASRTGARQPGCQTLSAIGWVRKKHGNALAGGIDTQPKPQNRRKSRFRGRKWHSGGRFRTPSRRLAVRLVTPVGRTGNPHSQSRGKFERGGTDEDR
jgi:hypothetical protein